MRGLCPNCEKNTELEFIIAEEKFEVRGELITVNVEYYKCSECGEEFEDPRSTKDPLDRAYREYRRRHGMLQPEEILSLRKHYGLTQKEISTLLGWGGATLSRYENGALQDEGHDRLLQFIKNPENMQELVLKNGDFLSSNKKENMLKKLSAAIEESCSLSNIFQRCPRH